MPDARDLSVPNLLFLKVSTSGLYRDDLSPTDAAQPWVMHGALMLCNEAGATINMCSHLIKSDGRAAKENAVKVHGISAWATTQVGIPESRFLGILADLLKTIPVHAMKVVTFGEFDRRIISSLYQRFGEKERGNPMAFSKLWESRAGTEFVNLQAPWVQQACGLPSEIPGELKWPTLDEAAQIILGASPREGFRDAYEDLCVIREIYFSLAARGFFGKTESAA